ncbi:hypothetical protein, partial [Klebsiella aerogenes]|uniref:hypothetical protein n=1 Tax=Klebsiella aerogenes TaxID=548 RepID=UPI001CC58143
GATSLASISAGTTVGFWFDADAGTLASSTDGTTLNSTATGLFGGRYAYSSGGGVVYNYGASANTTATTTVYLTAGTTWQVPADWNSSNN